jgi:nucleoside triphosphate pyrophosphatase
MPLWPAADPLVLASGSAIRRKLIEAAGIPVVACPADLDERGLEAQFKSETPSTIAAMLAREKASAVEQLHRGRLILAADQTLALGNERFSKPADRPAARTQLRALAGKTHELHSAIVFMQNATVQFEYVGVARLTMRELSDRFLDDYLDAVGSAASASVGAYQLEGIGIQLFERVEGDFFTILGLPLIPALDFLRRRGCLAQ